MRPLISAFLSTLPPVLASETYLEIRYNDQLLTGQAREDFELDFLDYEDDSGEDGLPEGYSVRRRRLMASEDAFMGYEKVSDEKRAEIDERMARETEEIEKEMLITEADRDNEDLPEDNVFLPKQRQLNLDARDWSYDPYEGTSRSSDVDDLTADDREDVVDAIDLSTEQLLDSSTADPNLPDIRRALSYDEKAKLESARVYGNIHNYAYYFVDLLIGHPEPVQRTSVIIDTGSSLCGYPCAGCGHCGRHIDAAFDVSKSPSAKWIKCNSNCNCKGDKCSYYQGYTEGSAISGFWFEDYARLGDTIQNNPPTRVRMGCHQNENKLFYTQKANGIFGLAGNGGKDLRSKPTILVDFLKDREHVNANVFSMCLSQQGGRLIAGGWNSEYNEVKAAEPSYVSLISSGKFYVVALEGLSLDGKVLGTNNFGRTIVDSGTTYTYWPSRVYSNVKRALFAKCNDNTKFKCGRRSGAECWVSSGTTLENIDSRFPHFELTISSKKFTWKPRSYMYRRGSGSTFCFTFDNNGGGGTVLGASWMIDHNVIFDRENKRMGVTDAHCPTYSSRPRGPKPGDFKDGAHPPAGTPVQPKEQKPVATPAPEAVKPATAAPAAVPPPTPMKPADAAATKSTTSSTSGQALNGGKSGSAVPAPATAKTAQTTSGGSSASSSTAIKSDATWLPSYWAENGYSMFGSDAKHGRAVSTTFLLAITLLAVILLSCSCLQLCKAFSSRRNYHITQSNPDDGIPVSQWINTNDQNREVGARVVMGTPATSSRSPPRSGKKAMSGGLE